jgi:nucleoside-diphosphate-sugar epimerase
MSRYLIAGFSGFLGTILTRELEKSGQDLVLVDYVPAVETTSSFRFVTNWAMSVSNAHSGFCL